MIWVLCGLGLPLALVLAWAFEVTVEGVRRTPRVPEEGEAALDDQPEIGTAYKLLVALGLVDAALAGGWYLVSSRRRPPRA